LLIVINYTAKMQHIVGSKNGQKFLMFGQSIF